jgi:hypothetical protein
MFDTAFKAGDLVEVRTAEEIFSTLDGDACLNGLPFMPEMLRYCGKTLRVASSAHKTCDTIEKTGGRRMQRAVHLDGVRCGGSAHGNCEAACLIFWRYEWLKRPEERTETSAHATAWNEQKLAATTQREEAGTTIYSCQATRLLDASAPLSSMDLRQYVADLRSRNVSLGALLRAMCFAIFDGLLRLGVGYRFLLGAYNRFQKLRGANPYPFATGTIPADTKTPVDFLDLAPGESVRVKAHDEILATLNVHGRNRGLWFDAEMTPFCGRTYTVKHRVSRIIDESTGKMLDMKAPCIVLDGVYCQAKFSRGRLLCPRAIYPYWRESWLERTADAPAGKPARD